MQSSVFRFAPDGRYLGRFGRPGQGPGELGPAVVSILFNEARNEVTVVDVGQQRLATFSASDGTFVGHTSLLRVTQASAVGWAIHPDGLFTQLNRTRPSARPQDNLSLSQYWPADGGDARSYALPLMIPSPGGEGPQLLLPPQPVAAAFGDLVVLMRTDQTTVVVVDRGGLTTVVPLDFELASVTEAQADDAMAEIEAMVQAAPDPAALAPMARMTMPEKWPVAKLFAQADRLFVVRQSGIAPSREALPPPTTLLTFDGEGGLEASQLLRPGFNAAAVAGSRIYGFERDSLDRLSVTVLAVAPPSG